MKNIYNLFVSVCEQTGNSTALIFQHKFINYNTLYKNVEKIYGLLLLHGVESGEVIGVAVKRSPNAFAVFLAILKIGAAYMPFNPLQSESEWLRMMKDSGCRVVVSDWSVSDKFFDGLWIALDEFSYQTDSYMTYSYTEKNSIKNLAYVMYTSGSTGKSKGVGIRQESLYNLVLNGTKDVGLTKGSRILALSNFAFDMSIPETIMPILIGMSVVLLDDVEVLNPRLIRKQIQNQQVDVLLITPTRMNMLLNCKRGADFLKSVTYILFGAEMISLSLINRLKEVTNAQIFNLYGPTETTAYLSYSNITHKDTVDIGKPIENMQIWLMDEEHKIIEGLGEGEIVIAGIGVAEGYLTSDNKQAFRKCPKISESLVYFTGDIAKRLGSGELIFLGRKDNQIKYRGYRLGLEAIEGTIRNRVKEIQDCVVLVYKENIDEFLILVYVSSDELEISNFKALMVDQLAKYAIPNSLIRVESLPLNKNGKIDRALVANVVKEYMGTKLERENI